jgi:hypothetical protein
VDEPNKPNLEVNPSKVLTAAASTYIQQDLLLFPDGKEAPEIVVQLI